MKKEICGIEVITSGCNIDSKGIEDSCIYAESLVETVKAATGYEPLKGIEKFVIYTESQKPETKNLIAHFKNRKTGQFERKNIISCSYASKSGEYSEGSIHLDAEQFHPLDSDVFTHELSHNIHAYLPCGKKIEVAKKHSELKKELIKRIKKGFSPSEAANELFLEYAFLHEFEFLEGDLICFKGYVGVLSRIIKMLPDDSAQAAVRAYAFHADDREFFAEMFSMYFHDKEKLAKKGLLDFAEKIIKG